jgi:hypothetical protein
MDAKIPGITRHGELVAGPAARVSAGRLARFARECSRQWWDLPLDEDSRRLVAAFERLLEGAGTQADFWAARVNVSEAAKAGRRPLITALANLWSADPFGVASFVQDLAWVTACHEHRDRIAELERTATDEERFAWRFWRRATWSGWPAGSTRTGRSTGSGCWPKP